MLKIYGADLSPYSNKVKFVANALNVEYEYIYIKIKEGDNRTEKFLRMNPFGKIPLIDDDGFILFESDAITRYLAQREGSGLYPTNLHQRAIVDQWMNFSAMHVGIAMGKVLFNRVFAPLIKKDIDAQALKEGINFLNEYLPTIDEHLLTYSFMAGREMTLADFTMLSALDPAEIGDVDLSPYSGIVKWREGLKEKNWYQKCHRTYGERLALILKK